MIRWLIPAGLWVLATHMTIAKHGPESAPLMVFLLVMALIGSGGGGDGR